jgi:excisionase family DNA binding protein
LSNTQTEILTTKEAATCLKLSARYLEDLRRRGGGPQFLAFGKSIRYRRADVDAWAASRARKSTSDQGAAA